ncbi:unnamed protein product, partial [Staurois parvus]
GVPPKLGSSTLKIVPLSALRIGTFGERGGGGERVPKFDRYPLPLPLRSPRQTEVVLLPSLPEVLRDR